jgi:hypothetical protein
MPLIGLVLLQGAALAGLVIGRRALIVPLLAAAPAAVALAGEEAGALALLSAVGFALGAHLHELIADHYAGRR